MVQQRAEAQTLREAVEGTRRLYRSRVEELKAQLTEKGQESAQLHTQLAEQAEQVAQLEEELEAQVQRTQGIKPLDMLQLSMRDSNTTAAQRAAAAGALAGAYKQGKQLHALLDSDEFGQGAFRAARLQPCAASLCGPRCPQPRP